MSQILNRDAGSRDMRSVLSQQLVSVNEQNKGLREEMIELSLSEQRLIEEKSKLQQQLHKRDKQLIQTRLKQKHLQHSLKQVNKLYDTLQQDYHKLLTSTKTHHSLQLRNLYKKQTQLAMDLTLIQRESYRETKNNKNQQINKYQSKILDLVNQNDNLKAQILTITAQYNQQIYQLKKENHNTQHKLKSIQQLQQKHNNIYQTINQNNTFSKQPIEQRLKYIQIEMKLQNTKEKLQFYIKENNQMRKMNLQLIEQNNQLLQNITIKQKQNIRKQQPEDVQNKPYKQNTKEQGNNASLEYMQRMMEENINLRREIEEISGKYVLLSETYPQLVQDYDTIRELQENINKLTLVKQLQKQLSSFKQRQQSLQQSLSVLQKKYLQQLKARQVVQYKSSILMKRFNQMFIRMNPYFNIYEYQSLELNQEEYRFFNQYKDYKQLKDYQKEIYQLKREIKQQKHKEQTKYNKISTQLKDNILLVSQLQKKLNESQQKVQNISTSNKLLTQQLSNYQLLNIDSNLMEQTINENKINTKLTLPLMQNMINQLQLDREQLLKVICVKDNTILQLAQQLKHITINQNIQYLPIRSNQQGISLNNNNTNNNSNMYIQISELVKANESLQEKYQSSINQLTTLIHKLQTQLNNQHNIYQMDIQNYQQQYQQQFKQLSNSIQKWVNITDNLKNILKLKQQQSLKYHQSLKYNQQHNKISSNNQYLQQHQNNINQNDNQIQRLNNNNNNINNQMEQQPQQHIQGIIQTTNHNQQNQLLRHPSTSNLDRLTNILTDQNNNKLIGQSTVQNLTIMLKKYEQQMSEVLLMCGKLSEQYSELKKQVKNQQQLQQLNTKTQLQNNNLNQQNTHLKYSIDQKNKTITTIQQLYKNKQTQYNQLKHQLNTSKEQLINSLQNQKRKNILLTNQLNQIKSKLYQLTSTEQINQNSLMNKGQFETIFIMHANKNKQITHLTQKNQLLENKLQTLTNQLNIQQTQSYQHKSTEITPLQKQQLQQLTQLLQQTDLIHLIKKANSIVKKQKEEQDLRRLKEIEEQRKLKEMQEQRKLKETEEQRKLKEAEEQIKQKEFEEQRKQIEAEGKEKMAIEEEEEGEQKQ